MEKTKFTPGPWEISQDNGWRCGVLTSDEHFFIECETVSDKNEACFENDANARLIAAAPEMYGLLEKLISAMNNHEVGEYYLYDDALKIANEAEELLAETNNPK